MPIDLRKAIADRQERDAIRKACAFAREGANAAAYWEEVGKRALRTYKACGRASIDDQVKESEKAKKSVIGLPKAEA